jgi:hypothetical protein
LGFSILDFGLRRKAVRKIIRSEILSVNDPKSKTCPFDILRAVSKPSRIQHRKWLGLSVIVFVLAMFCAVAQAQQPKKLARIGYLSTFDAVTDSNRFEAIRLALRELGYIEGRNIVIEHRYGEGKADRSLSLPPSWCVWMLISSWYLEAAG